MDIPDVQQYINMERNYILNIEYDKLREISNSISIINPESIHIESTGKEIVFWCQGPSTDYKTAVDTMFKEPFKYLVDSKVFKESVKILALGTEKNSQGVKIETLKNSPNSCLIFSSGDFLQMISVENE